MYTEEKDDMSKIRWGVLSTAKIGTEKVLPRVEIHPTGSANCFSPIASSENEGILSSCRIRICPVGVDAVESAGIGNDRGFYDCPAPNVQAK